MTDEVPDVVILLFCSHLSGVLSTCLINIVVLFTLINNIFVGLNTQKRYLRLVFFLNEMGMLLALNTNPITKNLFSETSTQNKMVYVTSIRV